MSELIAIYIQPGAKKSELCGTYDGKPKIRIKAPAVDNKANDALIEFIAKELKIAKNRIQIVKGEKCRLKTLQIDAPSELIIELFQQDKN